MGTNYTGEGSNHGIIPKVMESIFKRVELTKDNTEFLIRVSFIEVICCEFKWHEVDFYLLIICH